MMRQRALLLFLGILPTLGCGAPDKAAVQGKVTYNGKSVRSPQFVVSFIGPNNQVVTADIDPGGNYRLPEAQVGFNKILVFYRPRDARGPKKVRDRANEENCPPFKLPEHYSDQSRTPLSFTVEAGSDNTYNVEVAGPPLPE